MNKPLKILIVEDSQDDVILIERELNKEGILFTSLVVNKRPEFQKALKSFMPDVVLSDHSLPQFNSIEALQLCRVHEKYFHARIPFILITGQLSEEFAVQCFKAGVDDYILKDRLKRLPFSIVSVLARCQAEKERLQYSEELIVQQALMQEAEHLAKFGSWQADLVIGKHIWSDEMYNIYGYDKPGDIEPNFETFFSHVHPADVARLKNGFETALASSDSYQIDFRIIDKRGNVKYISSDQKIHRDQDGRPVRLVGFNVDITRRRKAEIQLSNSERNTTHHFAAIRRRVYKLFRKDS